jgi:hypothetical protein
MLGQEKRSSLRIKPPASNWLLAFVLLIDLKMILQVGADTGQIVHHRNIQFTQQCRRADAGALQNLRRGNRTGTQQNFAPGVRRLHLILFQISHAVGALAGEQDAIRQCMSDDAQIRPLPGQLQVAGCGAVTASVERSEGAGPSGRSLPADSR